MAKLEVCHHPRFNFITPCEERKTEVRLNSVSGFDATLAAASGLTVPHSLIWEDIDNATRQRSFLHGLGRISILD
jgi:hypothetical protein